MTHPAPSLDTLKQEITHIKQHSKLAARNVVILGASKTKPAETIEKHIESGLKVFGENRVQEAEAKWPDLKKRYPGVELHLIGPLQTNKVKAALALFDVIQTLDRPKLAEEVSRLLSPTSRNSQLATRNFYIQVNTGDEPQKAGVSVKEAPEFIRYCRDDLKLPITGLMCIPPAEQPPAPHFALLRKIAMENNLRELSMGMSEDYAEAIRMGSTCVRLGRKLFGERKPSSCEPQVAQDL